MTFSKISGYMQISRLIALLFIMLIIGCVNAECPVFNAGSHNTKNNMGKSSYTDIYMGAIFSHLYTLKALNLNNPVLIIGAGYGAGVTELLSLGAKKIFLNDLSYENLVCAKQFISQTLPKKKSLVNYLPGNITQSTIFKTIPDNSLSTIYAKNVIHFLDATQLVRLIKNSNKKLKNNGLIILVFENPVLNQQIDMVKEINSDFQHVRKINQKQTLDHMIKAHYKKNRRCSLKAYNATSKSIRKNGFPCIMHGKNFLFNLLMPDTIEQLLIENGFNMVGIANIGKQHDTFIIMATKKPI